MQVPQPGSSQNKRAAVDEHFINFEGMKKFIRSKIDKIETSSQCSPNYISDPPLPSDMETSAKLDPQPGAAASEPTCDAPSASTSDVNFESFIDEMLSQEEVTQAENSGEDAGKPPESTIMCRDFIRGTCKRPGTCKFAHKFDKEQLFGVYTFCRDFQNKTCTLPNCKYVHSSMYEQYEFYRTGKLPPHVIIPKYLPVAPQPSTSDAENRVNIPTSFNNPPAMLPSSTQPNLATYACPPPNSVPESEMDQEEFRTVRKDFCERVPSKCNFCRVIQETIEHCAELTKEKKERILEMQRQVAKIEDKKEQLDIIVNLLINLHKSSTQTPRYNSLFNTIAADLTKKAIFDELTSVNFMNVMKAGGSTTGADIHAESVLAIVNIFLETQIAQD